MSWSPGRAPLRADDRTGRHRRAAGGRLPARGHRHRPIPSFLVLTKECQASGGIAVTASHNPKEWNGLKFLGRGGLYLNPPRPRNSWTSTTKANSRSSADESSKSGGAAPVEPHLRRLLGLRHRDIRAGNSRWSVDCCNGAGALLAPRLLEALGCETVFLNAEPDGSFARASEPTRKPSPRSPRLVPDGADVGFVQDADADRLALVDEKGRPLGEELTLALAAHYVLAAGRGRSSATFRRPGPSTTSPPREKRRSSGQRSARSTSWRRSSPRTRA